MFFMASTKIVSEKTASEIQMLLGQKGASRILTEYEGKEISALSFMIEVNGKSIPFRLPLRWASCLAAMRSDRSTPRHYCNEDQAKRTAWRVLLRWVQAQFALIDTQMASITEVMLPYAQIGEYTLYEKLEREQFKMLPSPE
jgi:hypothetical protein